MAPTIDKIMDHFPHKNLQPIIGTPTYESILQLQIKLNANSESINTTLGDRKLGMLGLTIYAEE